MDATSKRSVNNARGSSLALFSIRETAAYAKVSASTVRRWIKDGLKTYRAGRQVRIDEADLISFLRAGSAR